MIQRRASGSYAVSVWDPALKRRRHVGTRAKLKDARALENEALAARTSTGDETVAAFAARWTRDFPRPKASTDRTNAERVSDFARQYARTRMASVDARTVDQYLSADPARKQRVPALRAMFNDAKRRGVVTHNPFANLGLSTTKGNRHKMPPTQEEAARLLQFARELTPPSFAGWLGVAMHTGMRPGELDALQWDAVDFTAGVIWVREQWNVGAQAFTLPKNGKVRDIALTPPAREALMRLPRENRWVFPNLRGSHFTPSSRAFHWNRARAAAGLHDKTLYLCTRHYAGWYMRNVLALDAAVIAHQLGHEDGGALVNTLYGHLERGRSLEQVRNAWGAQVTPLRVVREDTA